MPSGFIGAFINVVIGGFAVEKLHMNLEVIRFIIEFKSMPFGMLFGETSTESDIYPGAGLCLKEVIDLDASWLSIVENVIFSIMDEVQQVIAHSLTLSSVSLGTPQEM